jgi:hypothetical protein
MIGPKGCIRFFTSRDYIADQHAREFLMPQGQVSPVLRFIRRVRSEAPAGGEGDRQLLDRFVEAGEEAAFVSLVE